jgi:hypothetical protein
VASVNLPVVSGGGWTPIAQTFPLNQNDGNFDTFQGWPGFTAGSNDCLFDHTLVPDGATISSVVTSSLWDAGSAPAVVAVSCILGVNSVALGNVGDVASFAFSVPRPGGGIWTKTDLATMRIRVTSLQSGNGNNMKLRSSVLTVTYTLGGTMFVALIH